MSARTVLGLSGYAGSGKDLFASFLVKDHGWVRVAFADKVKLLAQDLGWDGKKDAQGREFLQRLGVGVREHLDSNMWVSLVEKFIEKVPPSVSGVVVTDVRFQNEVRMLRRYEGIWARIRRPGVYACNDHVSEHDLEGLNPDFWIENDGSLAALREKATVFATAADRIDVAEIMRVT